MSPFPPEDLVAIGAADLAVVLATDELVGWHVTDDRLRARFATPTYAAGLAMVGQLGAEAERSQHHPDLTLAYGYVEVWMHSHDVDAITQRDVRLARAISSIAAGVGAIPQPPANAD